MKPATTLTDSPRQSTAQRQEAFRARRAMLGMSEVRGIYLHADDHAEIKRLAKLLAHQRQRNEAK